MIRPMTYKVLAASLVAVSTLLASAVQLFAIAADAGHRPFNADVPFGDVNGGQSATPRRQFREPYVEISNDPANPSIITVYSVIKRLNNSYGVANQTGGTLYVKGASQNSWTQVGLTFHSNEGDYQYWKASFTTRATALNNGTTAINIGPNEVIQYYFYLTFNAGAENTFIYAGPGYGDLASRTAAGGTNDPAAATAAANPFTVRNRPAWIFHANNRVVSGNDVQFWAKVGYIGDPADLSTRWATNGAVYYTVDGTEPAGSLGQAGNASTHVAQFNYDHPDNSNTQNSGTGSVAGTPMWWSASVPNLLNLPLGATIKYKIGFWNAPEEKFAEHNAGVNNTTFAFTNGTVGDPVLTVNGVNANYTTSHFFIDETKGDSVPVTISFQPGQDAIAAEVYTNLSRRDKVSTPYTDAAGIATEEGIEPIDGDTVAAGDDSHYYKAYTMTRLSAGNYSLTLPANKTGAYRLTARWKVQGDTKWRYYTNIGAGRRDHALVVSPITARKINLYEMNVFNVESSDNDLTTSNNFANRGTFEDLYDAPNAPHNYDRNNPGAGSRWNLGYLKNLGCNWLWFQPIHPITLEAQQGHDPGSPYSVRNFFEINPLMSANYDAAAGPKAQANRDAARQAFSGFVSAANNEGVGVMLDAPFNHAAPDIEVSSQGTSLFGNNPAPSALFRDTEARFFSRAGNYAMRAYDANSIAIAPDRGDFGKWGDVRDIYFGRYAALVDTNGDNGSPNDNGNYLNEQDWFDYSIGNEGSYGSGNGHFDAVTQHVWKYFAQYTLYWLDQTGVPAGSDMATQTARGIGGLRADFGQGLPPQVWEYIINKTRARKWNFVFMAESLDGGAVTYRSNRHFDVLNENIVFPLKSASNASDYRSIFEARRSAYGQGLVLLNDTSHDEENYDDPWQAVVRYAVVSTVDGVPLIFPGQELGISRTFGYQLYETNFGKQIVDFKDFNSMMPAWNDTNYGNDQLYPVYAGIGQARLFSPALRSSGRYFLNEDGGGNVNVIFAVAKYEALNNSPATSDVVFAFANTDRSASPSGNYHVNQDVDNNGVNDYGIKRSRTYNVRNIAAYTARDSSRRDTWLWGSGRTGADVLDGGIFVGMNKVPTTDAAWATAPFEAQYLKLYDVTAPSFAPGAAATANAYSYVLGTSGTVSWNAASADGEGVAPMYKVSVTINGSTSVSYTSNTSFVINASAGQTVQVTVRAVNPNDTRVEGPVSSTSTLKFIDPAGDDDGDGLNNAGEDLAGTNPFDANSLFRVTAVARGQGGTTVTWSSVAGRRYQLESASSPTGTYSAVGTVQTASGSVTSVVDTNATGPAIFYRVRIVP